jgi:hypothetical protein
LSVFCDNGQIGVPTDEPRSALEWRRARPRRHVLIDGATLALVISKKLCFSAMQNVDDGPSRPIATLQNFGR